ncbi:MAG: branched-chain amino acid ABC transporter permease [Deltaproteobacteria bacterium]|nr:branched-chain amino acid ABC transporter permease [Deltaproteobacteria bacterium]
MSYRPCGNYHQYYKQDHAWWQTKFVWGKMIFLFITIFYLFPQYAGMYVISIANVVGYTILSAMGVQLLIGYCGQITLGHSAFLAMGAYTCTLLMLQLHIPYPIAMIMGGIVGGLWSVLFGLPSARVKGFYLIMTTMAAQFLTVEFFITQYVSQIGGRGVAFSIPPGAVKIGPWMIKDDKDVYYLMVILVVLLTVIMANLVRSKIGRAWIAIRDNDIAAETMGVNIVLYKLLAFFVAGFFGGIAGAFWVTSLAAVSPEHFHFGWSLWLVGVILIGGVGSIHGTIFGALFMTLIPEGLKFLIFILTQNPVFVNMMPFLPLLLEKFLFVKEAAFGLAIALFLIYEPNGISYRWWQIKNYFNLWPFSY